MLAREQSVDAIVTNPPYISATRFIEHALRLMSGGGKVAMLLRTDFDHAKTRRHLFSDSRSILRFPTAFAKLAGTNKFLA